MKKLKHYYLYFVVILVSSLSVSAQEHTQTIRGTIVDKDSKGELIGANVVLIGVEPLMGASTDVNGQFRIPNVPIGRHMIRVSFIGYEEMIIPEINVGSGKEVVLNLELQESLNSMETLVFVAEASKDEPLNNMASVSARSFTVDEASRYAGSFSDPGRMASSFAGVASTNGLSNEISVRGNSPKGLLWRIEGVEVPSPNHLAGYASNGGIVTILSTNMMSNSDFMTGAYPSEYGNATSGVFDIKLRNGNNEQHEYAFQASLFGVEAAAEGPLKQGSKASYLLNYRYSTTKLIGDLGLVDKNEGLPEWQDLGIKINVPTKNAGEFQLFGVGGLSGVTELAIEDSDEWEYEYDNQNGKFHSNVGAVGASHRIPLSENTYLKTVLVTTGRDIGYKGDTLDLTYQKHFNGESAVKDYTSVLSTFINHKFSAKSVLRAGAIATRRGYDLFAVDRSPVAPYDMKTLVNSSGNFMGYETYFQWKYKLAQNLEVNTGLHAFYTGFNVNGKMEPRASVRWDLAQRQSLSFGFGYHSRLEPTSIYFEEINVNGVDRQVNKNLASERSVHYVVSYDRKLGDQMRMKMEAYYQNHQNVPIEDDPNSTFSTLNNDMPVTGVALTNKGTGVNKGLELTLEKFFDRNYYLLFTGSLYDATYVAGDGKTRNTKYNGNFITNVAAGKEIPLANSRSIGLDFRFVVAGGNRTTPINLDESRAEKTTVYDQSRAYSEQAPAYIRPDFKLSFTKNKIKSKRILALDIQNISDHQNLLNTYYDTRKDEIVKNYQFGMMPNISYRIEF